MINYYLWVEDMENARLTIKNELSALENVSAFLENLGRDWKISDEMLFNLNLVLEEVVTNIINYGYEEGQINQLINLDFILYEDHILIHVTDTAREFNPLRVPPPDDLDKPAHDRKIGGLGVYLVRQLMDEVTYQRLEGVNVLTLRKEFSRH